jgi:hypothetical protein
MLAPLIYPGDFDWAVAFEQYLRQEDFEVFWFALDHTARNFCQSAVQPCANAIRPALFASEYCSGRACTEPLEYGKMVQSNPKDFGPAALRSVNLRATDALCVVDIHYDGTSFLSQTNTIPRVRALPRWRILAFAYRFAVYAGIREQ